MTTNFIPKDQGRGVEDAAIRNNEMRLDSPTPRIDAGGAERGTKTKPVEGDINRKEGGRNHNQRSRKTQEPKMKAEKIPRQM